MDIGFHKGQMIDQARKVLDDGGTVEILLMGHRIEVIGLLARHKGALIEAKLEGGFVMQFDAGDPFAVILNG